MDSEIESNGSLQKRLICPLQRTFLLSREKKKCLKMLGESGGGGMSIRLVQSATLCKNL